MVEETAVSGRLVSIHSSPGPSKGLLLWKGFVLELGHSGGWQMVGEGGEYSVVVAAAAGGGGISSVSAESESGSIGGGTADGTELSAGCSVPSAEFCMG